MELLSAAGRRLRTVRRRHAGGAEGAEAIGQGGGEPGTLSPVGAQAAPDGAKAARLAGVLAGMSDGVMMVDAELRLLEWNARFPDYTGIPPEMLRIGLPMEEILRAQALAGEFGETDVEAEVVRRIERFRAGLSTGTIERRRPNGQVMELRRNRLADGGYVTLYTDVTARRQAEEQLRQAQKMEAVGHLTGGVAHDFNNLLMVILGNLDRADRSLKDLDLDRVGRGIEHARSGAKRAAVLTQRLLAFSRRQQREPRPVDPNALIAGMADLMRQSTASSVVVEFDFAECPWLVLADPNQFEIAVLNLVINARDAAGPGGSTGGSIDGSAGSSTGGSVTIETERVRRGDPGVPEPLPIPGQEFMRVTVRDTGTGMSSSVAARAFEPFFTTKPAGRGTGLGLYQVMDFATHAGGHVSIETAPGQGTAVTIILPRLVVQPVAGPESDAADAVRFTGRGEVLLVVEDEPDILACTTEGLEALGYRVLGAQDASSALTLLENTPDVGLLFTDIGLSGISGGQLAREVARRWPGLPVLTTSGGTEGVAGAEGVMGALGVMGGERTGETAIASIGKPYNVAGLAQAIRAVLDTRLAIPEADPAADA